MKLFSVLVLTAGSVTMIGCSTFGGGRRGGVDYGKEVRLLHKELRKTQAELEDLKTRNLILETKLKRKSVESAPESAPEAALVPSEPVLSAQPSAVPATLPEKARVAKSEARSAADVGEQMIYSKIIDTYRMHEVAELKKSVQILLKAYPDSIYADNALFLASSLGFELGDYAYARLQIERLLKEYPNSDKAVSALFAKAAIDKRERKIQAARETLLTIQNKFPGSPEAKRVGAELKLLGLATGTSKKRES